jgi:hypothetical protein
MRVDGIDDRPEVDWYKLSGFSGIGEK